MDLKRHYTHWDVHKYVRAWLEHVRANWPCSWNTYKDHPPGYALDAVSGDIWDPPGRGSPLNERVGDQIALHIIGMHPVRPVRWLIWWGYIWTPDAGWKKYGGWHGGHFDHIHVTYA